MQQRTEQWKREDRGKQQRGNQAWFQTSATSSDGDVGSTRPARAPADSGQSANTAPSTTAPASINPTTFRGDTPDSRATTGRRRPAASDRPANSSRTATSEDIGQPRGGSSAELG